MRDVLGQSGEWGWVFGAQLDAIRAGRAGAKIAKYGVEGGGKKTQSVRDVLGQRARAYAAHGSDGDAIRAGRAGAKCHQQGFRHTLVMAQSVWDVLRQSKLPTSASLFREVLKEHNCHFVEGLTWTTDALYRETPERVARRRAQGAITVEMECAGMQALCDFRKTGFFQFLYAGDNLGGESWDPRSLGGSVRLDDKLKIALLAFELGLKIKEKAGK